MEKSAIVLEIVYVCVFPISLIFMPMLCSAIGEIRQIFFFSWIYPLVFHLIVVSWDHRRNLLRIIQDIEDIWKSRQGHSKY